MRLFSAIVLVVIVPSIAAAQNRGIFIQGGALADIVFAASPDDIPVEFFAPASSSSTYRWTDLNGDRRWQPGEETSVVSSSLSFGLPFMEPRRSKSRVAPGASAAVGVFITPSVSLRVEGSYQGEHVTETTVDYLGQAISIEDRQATSTTDMFVAAGWHQGESRRTTITYLGGMVFRRQHEEFTVRYSVAGRSVPPLPPMIGLGGTPVGSLTFSGQDSGATSYSAGVMAGVDVTVNVSQHFAVVPQIRMVAADRTWNLRPGISMRWRP